MERYDYRYRTPVHSYAAMRLVTSRGLSHQFLPYADSSQQYPRPVWSEGSNKLVRRQQSFNPPLPYATPSTAAAATIATAAPVAPPRYVTEPPHQGEAAEGVGAYGPFRHPFPYSPPQYPPAALRHAQQGWGKGWPDGAGLPVGYSEEVVRSPKRSVHWEQQLPYPFPLPTPSSTSALAHQVQWATGRSSGSTWNAASVLQAASVSRTQSDQSHIPGTAVQRLSNASPRELPASVQNRLLQLIATNKQLREAAAAAATDSDEGGVPLQPPTRSQLPPLPPLAPPPPPPPFVRRAQRPRAPKEHAKGPADPKGDSKGDPKGDSKGDPKGDHEAERPLEKGDETSSEARVDKSTTTTAAASEATLEEKASQSSKPEVAKKILHERKKDEADGRKKRKPEDKLPQTRSSEVGLKRILRKVGDVESELLTGSQASVSAKSEKGALERKYSGRKKEGLRRRRKSDVTPQKRGGGGEEAEVTVSKPHQAKKLAAASSSTSSASDLRLRRGRKGTCVVEGPRLQHRYIPRWVNLALDACPDVFTGAVDYFFEHCHWPTLDEQPEDFKKRCKDPPPKEGSKEWSWTDLCQSPSPFAPAWVFAVRDASRPLFARHVALFFDQGRLPPFSALPPALQRTCRAMGLSPRSYYLAPDA